MTRIPGLTRRLMLARMALLWEAVWPNLWPVLGITGIFAALVLFDVLPLLPGWLHEEIHSPGFDSGPRVACKVWNNHRGDNQRVVIGAHRCSVPIAICIATLRAKSDMQGLAEWDLWGRSR